MYVLYNMPPFVKYDLRPAVLYTGARFSKNLMTNLRSYNRHKIFRKSGPWLQHRQSCQIPTPKASQQYWFRNVLATLTNVSV